MQFWKYVENGPLFKLKVYDRGNVIYVPFQFPTFPICLEGSPGNTRQEVNAKLSWNLVEWF